VSRALAGFPDVSPETRVRVQEAARQLGYIPNIYAQRLKKQRTDTIGLILPTFGPRFSDPFFSELLAGIGNEANQSGYDLLLSTHAPGPEEMRAYERLVRGRRVDGFLIVRVRRQDERIRYLVEQKFPFVSYGRSEIDLDYPWVSVDSYQGFCEAAEHLINLGHQRIGHICGPLDFTFSMHRLSAFRDTLQKHGLPIDESLIGYGDLTQAGGYQATMQLLDRASLPTAIMAANDLMALGAMSAIQEKGLAVGYDIAVLGFDGIPLAEHSHPPLTTVSQPIYQIAHQITRMLVQIINGDKPDPHQVLLQPSLIIRDSTQPAHPVRPTPTSRATASVDCGREVIQQ
jgi:LacI family transcriptional regulator